MISFQKKYFFIGGLPRSGSTLLSSILSQNPNIHSSVTSPVLPLVRSVYDVIAKKDEYDSLMSMQTKEKILKGIFDTYYSDIPKSIIFDTNRLWPNTFYLIKSLFPYTKIILTVRDIPWIMDSFERARNSNPMHLSSVFPAEHDYNVFTRADSLMMENGVIYNAYFALKTLWYSEFRDNIILVNYDDLAKNPKETIDKIYSLTNIEKYQHNFNNVSTAYQNYDSSLNFPGLHTTKAKVCYTDRRSVLPDEIWNKYNGMEFWK
jgi:sulfotransferase